MGPAGTYYYKFVTVHNGNSEQHYTTADNCRLCGHNGLLAVRPRFLPDMNYHYYVTAATRRVMVQARGESGLESHVLPIPFCAEIVPFAHPLRHPLVVQLPPITESFPLGLSAIWETQMDRLLKLVPDLKPGNPFNIVQSVGQEAGDRPQGWETNMDAERWLRHGYMTVVYGRDKLNELNGSADPVTLSMMAYKTPIVTANQSLAQMIHTSRIAAGTLPDDDQWLWDIWQEVCDAPDGIEQYHAAILANGN